MERPKLLLADDSLTIQRVINLTFADEGIDVIVVGDGDAALQAIADSKPDIVLADVHMPGPSGYEICSLLRGMDETANTPVILLVGSFEQFDPEEAERVGADAFVTKPFQSIRQLVEQVKELLDRAEQPEETPIQEDVTPAVSAAPEHHTADIEDLYQQSFAETVEMPAEMAAQVAAAAYSERLDDEMIETSYTADQPNEHVDHGFANSSIDDFQEVSVEEAEEFVEPMIEPQAVSEIDNSISYDETLQMDVSPMMVQPAAEVETVHTAQTEELRRDPFATTTDAFDLDEIDLLDITPSNSTHEYNFATPAESVSQGSNKQVVSLSPELLDIIVKKVVEKLSEKY